MFRCLCAAVLAALILAAATACGGGRIFGKQYEYEEDLTLSLDGSATVVVNASLPSLVALRGLPLPTDNTTRLKDDEIRALFASPVTEVTRVSPAWRRKGRRFVQVRMKVKDVRRLHEVGPFAWSRYSLVEKNGQHLFRQTVGASALRPASLQNYGWDGREIVAFRLHLPSKIHHHNARDLETNETIDASRGNILAWEQHLADRLDGRPVELEVRMESRSILYRTLFLFGGAFTAAVIVLLLLVWWTMRRGRDTAEAG
ncbi:MAG: hypothetical protein H0U19_11770 [Acidobacteria bacterium]|nr:hypothetical protein [Acidobacteriota bacterium]